LTHHLDLAQCIGTIAAAVKARTLQTYLPTPPGDDGHCRYAGPCAVGVCLPVDLRPKLDDTARTDDGDLSIASYFDSETLSCPVGQYWEWGELQDSHDMSMCSALSSPARAAALQRFEDHVAAMQAKYAPVPGRTAPRGVTPPHGA
jgi:hypothetical protein